MFHDWAAVINIICVDCSVLLVHLRLRVRMIFSMLGTDFVSCLYADYKIILFIPVMLHKTQQSSNWTTFLTLWFIFPLLVSTSSALINIMCNCWFMKLFRLNPRPYAMDLIVNWSWSLWCRRLRIQWDINRFRPRIQCAVNWFIQSFNNIYPQWKWVVITFYSYIVELRCLKELLLLWPVI